TISTEREILACVMRRWTKDIDPSTIPDAVLKSERARRNAMKRKSYTGGVFWKKHNPNTSRCRCSDCMHRRQASTTTVTKGVPEAAPRPKLPAAKPAAIGIGSRVQLKGESWSAGTVTYQHRPPSPKGRKPAMWTVEWESGGPSGGQGWYRENE